jgi:hypothetical protein
MLGPTIATVSCGLEMGSETAGVTDTNVSPKSRDHRDENDDSGEKAERNTINRLFQHWRRLACGWEGKRTPANPVEAMSGGFFGR